MSYRTLLISAVLAACASPAGVARADIVAVDNGIAVKDADGIAPSRGMTMSQVATKFGAPVTKIPAVGKPPISRWEYPGFVVYFERDYVIHSVVSESAIPASAPASTDMAAPEVPVAAATPAAAAKPAMAETPEPAAAPEPAAMPASVAAPAPAAMPASVASAASELAQAGAAPAMAEPPPAAPPAMAPHLSAEAPAERGPAAPAAEPAAVSEPSTPPGAAAATEGDGADTPPQP